MDSAEWGRGCAGKLDRRGLEGLLDLAATEGWDDAYAVPSISDQQLFVTTDTIEPFGAGVQAGRIAISHAASDLYASFATPIWAVVSLSVTQADLTSGRARDLVDGLHAALTDLGLSLAGGHTRRGSRSHMTITMGGTAKVRAPFRAPRPGDLLVIGDKPLGSGLLIAGVRAGLAPPGLDAALRSMEETNHTAAEWLAALPADSIAAVTDITGYGLLGALTAATKGMGWMVRTARLNTHQGVDAMLKEQVVSGLGDANWRDLGDGVKLDPDIPSLSAVATLVADPQTSGPLLAVVSKDLSKRFLAEGAPFHVIGEVREAGECVLRHQ